LADADVDACGRGDFLMLNRCLRAELVAFGSTASDREWYTGQLSFLRHTACGSQPQLLPATQ
jgi:hypothetical protein